MVICLLQGAGTLDIGKWNKKPLDLTLSFSFSCVPYIVFVHTHSSVVISRCFMIGREPLENSEESLLGAYWEIFLEAKLFSSSIAFLVGRI